MALGHPLGMSGARQTSGSP
ncbi:hypothetical protein QU862_30025 [Escherichia coli]|nr:hypothetical protein [Escherichia coli]